MDAEQFDKLTDALHRVAAATLAAAMTTTMERKANLKVVQETFNDCYMIVNPTLGTKEQGDFQERIDRKGW